MGSSVLVTHSELSLSLGRYSSLIQHILPQVLFTVCEASIKSLSLKDALEIL